MKLVLFFIFAIILIQSATAEVQTLGYFKQNSEVLLQQSCDNCSFVNISYVALPNTTYILSEQAMTKSGYSYSYTLISNYTQEFGRYIVCTYGDLDGEITSDCYDFYINSMGRPEPAGSIIVLFVISFLLILGFLVYVLIFSFGHALKKDFDFIDLAVNLGIYFALLGFFIMQKQYLGNPTIDSIMDVLVIVGVITHVFCAFVFLTISMVWNSMEQQRRESGTIR